MREGERRDRYADRTGSQVIKSGANQPWAHSINERLRDTLHLLLLEPPIYFISGVGPTLPNRSNANGADDATEIGCRDIFEQL